MGSWRGLPQVKSMLWVQARNGSLFPSAIFTLYCTYLCYSALVSEPHDYICNGLGQRINAASATTLATGELCVVLALLATMLSPASAAHSMLPVQPCQAVIRTSHASLTRSRVASGEHRCEWLTLSSSLIVAHSVFGASCTALQGDVSCIMSN